jgi:ferredoxin, 2Fe-2S
MPTIKVLPNEASCPEGLVFEAPTGTVLIEALLSHGIHIDHACEKQCACTTCHVYVREGSDSIEAAEEKEDDMLDKAWGLDLDSRLSCQAVVGEKDLVVEIPKYTLNMVSESQ